MHIFHLDRRTSFELDDFMINCDVANKLQEETLKHTKRLITKAVEISGCKNVVLSGGYFLNCLNNYQYLDIDPEINSMLTQCAMMVVLL